MAKKDHLIIFDTTLRDGEQTPGASLNTIEKLEIALQLERLGVDIIEAGFPVSSPGDFEAVSLISKRVKTSGVCALARCVQKDIDAAWGAIKDAEDPTIHVFLGISKIHLQEKLKKTPEQALEMIVDAVKYAKKYCPKVEFSTEDTGRADLNYVIQVLNHAIAAGATTVNIPDTTGYTQPNEYAAIIRRIKNEVEGIENVTISTHCHNDLGLAVANSLAGVQEGVRQVECTVNGVGERAGNASLEEVVMAVTVRPELYPVTTRIKTQEIYKTSRLVSNLLNIPVQPNKAIVGKNAFAHSSGIHQDGVLKKRETYEIIDPKLVGVDESAIILTARSGKHALTHKLEELGYILTPEQLEETYQRFKLLADTKKEIYEADLHTLVRPGERAAQQFSLVDLEVKGGLHTKPSANIVLKDQDNHEFPAFGEGTGPVDAAFSAVNQIVKKEVKLLEFLLTAVTSGIDAQAEVRVMIESKGKHFVGRGIHTDIVIASAQAYLDALNQLY